MQLRRRVRTGFRQRRAARNVRAACARNKFLWIFIVFLVESLLCSQSVVAETFRLTVSGLCADNELRSRFALQLVGRD